ncbi:hypothetical protein ACTPEM_24435 [Clostridioides difficile]
MVHQVNDLSTYSQTKYIKLDLSGPGIKSKNRFGSKFFFNS